MAKKRKNSHSKNKKSFSAKKSNTKTLAVICLLLNILIIPGLGSIIGGKTKEGIWQLIIAVLGILTLFIYIGAPILIIAWIWALISGIKLIQEAG